MINLHLGDCLEAMRQMPDKCYDLAIVDPPYGIGADSVQNNSAKSRIKADGKSKAGRGWKLYKETSWDADIPNQEYFDELFRVSKNQIIWGGNYMIEHLYASMGWIVWNKGQRNFSLADGELAWSSFNKAIRIFDFSRGEALAEKNEYGQRFHPTQKPVALYQWCLEKYANPGDRILDTHLGSGSIAIACHNMGYDLDGWELDPDYFAAAKARLETHQQQQQLW